MNKKSRREHLKQIATESRTMIFYEAPHKLLSTLKDMAETLGNREIALVRELTKIHEEVNRTTLEDAIAYYEQNSPKGEFVLIIRGVDEVVSEEENYTLEQAAAMAQLLIDGGEAPTKAAKTAAQTTGYKKNDIYAFLTKNKL
jgi:16S rRNA (cytidine1402-2'-O)-methyltransferase